MREAFAVQKLLTFFQQKYWCIWDINIWNFNDTLTNDVVSFEQPGPDVSVKPVYWGSHDDLLAVSIKIYKIRIHRSNIPQDKLAIFPILVYFFKIKYYVWKLAAATAIMVR